MLLLVRRGFFSQWIPNQKGAEDIFYRNVTKLTNICMFFNKTYYGGYQFGLRR